MSVQSSETIFPQEIFEVIIDCLQNSCSTLKMCSLVCRAFVPRTRLYLFAILEIPASNRLEQGVIRVQKVGFPRFGYPGGETRRKQAEEALILRLQCFLSIPNVCTLVRNLYLHVTGFASWGKLSPYYTELSKLNNLRKITFHHLAVSPVIDIFAQNQKTLQELHIESPCFVDPPDMVATLEQSDLRSLRVLTLKRGPLVESGSWLELSEKAQLRKSNDRAPASAARAYLETLSLEGLNLPGSELQPCLRILFSTDQHSVFDVSGLHCLEISFSIYSNRLMDFGNLFQTVGRNLRRLEISLKSVSFAILVTYTAEPLPS